MYGGGCVGVLGGEVRACLLGCVGLSEGGWVGFAGVGGAPWMAQLQVNIKVSLLVGACLSVCLSATVQVDVATTQHHPDLRL